MAEIIKYKDLSDSSEKIKIPNGSKISDVIPGIDWNNYVIFANGKKVSPDYKPKSKDIVIIRAVAHSGYSGMDWALTILTGGLYSIVKMGIDSYEARKNAEKAAKELEKLKAQTNNDKLANIPYIKGASNALATGQTQPYIIGRNLMTPYILNAGAGKYKGFHTISGDCGVDQFYNVVLENGFNNQIIESLSCDDVQVANLLQDKPQENTADNPKYYFKSNSAFGDTASFIEIAQDGKPFENADFNIKIIENEINAEIKHEDDEDYEDLIYTVEPNSKSIDVCIMFNGMYHMTNEGIKGKATRNINPFYSLDYAQILADGGDVATATWKPFALGFNQYLYYPEEKKEHKGVYTAIISVASIDKGGKYLYDKILADLNSYAIKNKSSWEFLGGEDIRNNDAAVYDARFSRGKRPTYLDKGWIECKISGIYEEVIPEHFTNTYSNNFSFNKNVQIRFNAHQDLSFEECFHCEIEDDGTEKWVKNQYPIAIKLSSPDKKTTEGTSVDQCYLQWIQSRCFNTEKSKNAEALIDEQIIGEREAKLSTIIGVHVKATTANEDKIGKINVITNGLAPTFDEETESWVFEDEEKTKLQKVMTSNLSSWILEILTSDSHAPSKISLDEIDMEAFGDYWKFCKKNRINVNKVLTQGATKENILSDLMEIGRGVLYQNIYGKISVAWDNVKENAIALLNEQNLISFSYKKDMNRFPDGVRATFIDATGGYTENSIIEMYDGTDAELRHPESLIREINVSGITAYDEVHDYCHYRMNCASLRKREAKAEVGKEGIYYTPYSKILVQHSALSIGLGNAEIKATITDETGNITGLELYDAIDLTGNELQEIFVSINCVNAKLSGVLFSQIINDTNRTKEIFFVTPISAGAALKPNIGDTLSYGSGRNLVTEPFIIGGIEPTENGYTLSLYDYDERIFDFGDIPEYVSPLNNSTAGMGGILPSEIPNVYPTIEQVVQISKENAQAVRVLTSLMNAGTVGEVAMYNGIFFRFDGVKWNRISENGYLGALVSTPMTADIDSFFLSLFEGKAEGILELHNGSNLVLSDNTEMEISLNVQRGFIYYADATGWHKDTNRNSYRYIIAMTDLSKYNFALPDALPEIIESGEPKYLGILTVNPSSFSDKDWFVWGGETTETFEKGEVYKLEAGVWEKINQETAGHEKELMRALPDLLKVQNAGTGYFSTIFANALIANEAFITKLASSVIKLQKDADGKGGIIYSDEYNGVIDFEKGEIKKYGNNGWAIDYKGNSDFNNVNVSGRIIGTKGYELIHHLNFSYTSKGWYSQTDKQLANKLISEIWLNLDLPQNSETYMEKFFLCTGYIYSMKNGEFYFTRRTNILSFRANIDSSGNKNIDLEAGTSILISLHENSDAPIVISTPDFEDDVEFDCVMRY